MVGNSAAVVKRVQLPTGGMECEPTAVNKQADWWQDRFEVTIEGDQLSVQRLDVNHGWGQKLEIRCRCSGSSLVQWQSDPKKVTAPISGQLPKPNNHVYPQII